MLAVFPSPTGFQQPSSQLGCFAGAGIELVSTGWSDCVLWNPHLTMESCYDNFVCVENAQFSKPITVKPGEDWVATVNMSVFDL